MGWVLKKRGLHQCQLKGAHMGRLNPAVRMWPMCALRVGRAGGWAGEVGTGGCSSDRRAALPPSFPSIWQPSATAPRPASQVGAISPSPFYPTPHCAFAGGLHLIRPLHTLCLLPSDSASYLTFAGGLHFARPLHPLGLLLCRGPAVAARPGARAAHCLQLRAAGAWFSAFHEFAPAFVGWQGGGKHSIRPGPVSNQVFSTFF